MTYLQRYAMNTVGRDYAVGDIHGHFSKLMCSLEAVGFDTAVDRLFSVGDLVDRGPESTKALDWLGFPWFHAVRGNHEDYIVRALTVDQDNHRSVGGAWFYDLSQEWRDHYTETFAKLPTATEVETPNGIVGLVHADPIVYDWSAMEVALTKKKFRDRVMRSRDRHQAGAANPVRNVHAVVCGHVSVDAPVVIGNVHYIDTKGWKDDGAFTLLDLHTLSIAPINEPAL